MAIVVNDPNNLPPRIFVIDLAQLKHLSYAFLSNVTKPQYKIGVEREKYYVIKVNLPFHFSQSNSEVEVFTAIVNILYNRKFQMVMFRK